MATLLPARFLRPAPGHDAEVLCPPYDVVSTEEAAVLADGRPHSLLHVTRPEIDVPSGAPAAAVHAAGRAALDRLVAGGVLVPNIPRLYVYRLVEGAQVQHGVVGCVPVADYDAGVVAVHERTRADKEADRVAHLAALEVHDEPVFLMHRADSPGAAAVRWVAAATTAGEPVADVTDPDGVRHTLWPVADDDVAPLVAAFEATERLYVADGHHRCAAAAAVARARPDLPGAAVFPAVVFPADELTVLPYHRVVADLGGHDAASFLAAVGEHYAVEPSARPVDAGRGEVGIRLRDGWFRAVLRSAPQGEAVDRLDVAVLSRLVLGPVLGITDVRTDPRIAFVGGSRGTAELDRLVGSGAAAVAFSMPATAADDVVAVADAGGVMPPKSTWFSPKLGSGLFLHPMS